MLLGEWECYVFKSSKGDVLTTETQAREKFEEKHGHPPGACFLEVNTWWAGPVERVAEGEA